jgi:hypothetical protein
MTSATVIYCKNADTVRNYTVAMLGMSIVILVLSIVMLSIVAYTQPFNQRKYVNIAIAFILFILSALNVTFASLIDGREISTKQVTNPPKTKYAIKNLHAIKTINDWVIALSAIAVILMIFNASYSTEVYKLAIAERVNKFLLMFMVLYGVVMVALSSVAMNQFTKAN